MIWFLLNILLAFGLEYVLIFLHELGHVAAAKIGGLKVLSVRLGYGRRLLKVRILGTPIIFNSIPVIGFTTALPRNGEHVRFKLWLHALGGPLVHVFFLIVILIVSPQSYYLGHVLPKVTSQFAPLEAFLFANLLLFLFNVVPRKIESAGASHWSDGYLLIKIPFTSDRETEELVRGLPRLEAHELIREGSYSEALRIFDRQLESYPDDALLIHDKALVQLNLGEFTRSRATFLSLLEAKEFSEKGHDVILLNNIAWLDAVIGEQDSAERANNFSNEAFSHDPTVAIFRGTRGSVLVRFGDADEGTKLLESSFKKCSDPDARAAEAVFIALGHAKQNRFKEAYKWLKTAERESPGYALNAVIRGEIQILEEVHKSCELF